MNRFFVICCLLLLTLVGMAQGAAGSYTWYWAQPGQALGEHGTVELRADGSVSWSGGKSGHWSQTGSQIVIDWGNGKDTLNFNGSTLSGSNQAGWSVQGQRQGGGGTNEVVLGNWGWYWAAPGEALAHHGTLTFNADGSMQFSGGKSGRWSRTGRNQYRLDWDGGGSDNMTMADGDLLQGRNQSGWSVEGRR